MQLELIQSLRTGHAVIDADHQHIIESINAITRDVTQGGELAASQMLLDEFIGMCEAHFQREEEILAQASYPELDEHAAYHNEMLANARAAKTLYISANDPAQRLRHLEDMVAYLIDDIVRSDMAFVSYLQAHGVTRERP